ncbi:MAG: aspartate-semialdehyde dehydrogenase [Phycisphaeraceae bacterium]|nr:aspartate-semialdehyde dehydrogenase [Phycisphaeraceae bacterium]
MPLQPHVAVVGATGAVGAEMLSILGERRFPLASLRALASPKSAGQRIGFDGRELVVEALTPQALDGVDIALFSAGSAITKQIVPLLRDRDWPGCIIDNSSAFRMDPAVPLIVPEVNPDALFVSGRAAGNLPHHPSHNRPSIVANPNCSTIILLTALNPLRKAFGVREMIVSTYQAASGAGAKGMAELEAQTRADLAREVVRAGVDSGGVFHEPYAFNLFSHNSDVDPTSGLNVEEVKMIKETHRIWNDPSVRIAPTCIRVPVRRAHAESVHVTLDRHATEAQVRDALARSPGVRVVDDRARNDFPTPLKAAGQDDVLVGRIRPSPIQPDEHQPAGSDPAYRRYDLFICGDQLRKGAALNAVQIAELLIADR